MSRPAIESLRAEALKLIRLARQLPDPEQSSELEAIAIEVLKQAGELERTLTR
jgi:hypothetical protein